MPEGPSILHLANQLQPFVGKIVQKAGGYGPMETKWLNRKKLVGIKTWGKHLLLVFNTGTVKIHLGLFGDVLVDERKKVNRSFFLEFAKGEINGYVVKATKIEEPLDEVYDWRTDIMSSEFDPKYVRELFKDVSDKTISEVLMNQEIFTGVGNKIRNEALYRAGIHPYSITAKIPAPIQLKLIKEAAKYASIFYNELEDKGINDSFAVYQQEFAKDGSEVTMEILKKEKRKIFYSEHKQKLYK